MLSHYLHLNFKVQKCKGMSIPEERLIYKATWRDENVRHCACPHIGGATLLEVRVI